MKSVNQKKELNIGVVNLLIFDLDGTILKSNKVNFESIKRGLADMGWDVPVTQEGIDELMGESSENFYRQILPPDKFSRKEELRGKVHQYYAPMIAEYGCAFTGVLETLEKLKNRGYRLALYSYASIDYFDMAISTLGIGKYLDYAECVQRNNLTKSELIKKIKKNFANINAAVVGDSIHDIDSAKETGNISVGVCYGYGGDEIKTADVTINSVSELLGIFDRRLPLFNRIRAVIDEKKSKDRSFVVGINGIDASGKTMFAQGLKDFLTARDYKVQVINIDDFPNPKAVRYSGSDQIDNYYNKSFNIETILNKFLIPIRQKSKVKVKLPVISQVTDKYETEKSYEFNQNTIIIFEGLFIFRKELAPYIDYKIFLDISAEICKMRAAVRDVPIYGQEILKRYDEKYLPAQKRYLSEIEPEKIADLVIDNMNWERPRIKKSLS